MSINRYRLKHLAKSGNKAAMLTSKLLSETDKLLSVILLCNNFANAVERGETSSDRQPYKWQENISAYCVPKMVSKDTELFK